MKPQRIAVVRVAGMATAAACVLAGAGPAFADSSGSSGSMTISVTVPETIWNTPNQFGMTLLPDGEVEVVDSRALSPGWSINRHLGQDGTLTVTVLS